MLFHFKKAVCNICIYDYLHHLFTCL